MREARQQDNLKYSPHACFIFMTFCRGIEEHKIEIIMWIWIIIIAVVIGAAVGYFNSGKSEGAAEGAAGGAMAGGCLAASCLARIALAALGIILVLWLFNVLFG